ncbi:response regulator transcription factor [Thermosynechococcus sp.]|uniref:response regulator transcription factor n=1 Tax=Thermosynechococcus sp. TaxID=2814275 RepID=UPI00391B46AF
MGVHVEIIESNPHLRSLLGWHLQQVGHVVHLAGGSQQGQEVFQLRHPDLVVLDLDLQEGNGLELCRWLHHQRTAFILALSAQQEEAAVVRALRAGADDYLAKPFGMQEFLARVEVLARRSRPCLPSVLNLGELQVNLVQRRVVVRDVPVDLTPQEFSLLYVLTQMGGIPLSRQELLRRAWPESIDNPRTVDTHILSLRKKIEVDPQQPRLIQTVRNVGYRLHLEPPNGRSHQNEKLYPSPSRLPAAR